MTKKIQVEYHIHKHENEKVILLDAKNTFKNIFDMLKKKHPNIKIEISKQCNITVNTATKFRSA